MPIKSFGLNADGQQKTPPFQNSCKVSCEESGYVCVNPNSKFWQLRYMPFFSFENAGDSFKEEEEIGRNDSVSAAPYVYKAKGGEVPLISCETRPNTVVATADITEVACSCVDRKPRWSQN